MTNSIILEKQRENFRKFMETHKLNASSWAKKADIAEATIRHYLSGRNKSITAINIEKLAKAIGVTSNSLLNGENNSKEILDNNSIKVQKDLFVQTFTDVNNFITQLNLKLDPTMHANILLSWYELAQMHQEKNLDSRSLEPFKDLIQKIATHR